MKDGRREGVWGWRGLGGAKERGSKESWSAFSLLHLVIISFHWNERRRKLSLAELRERARDLMNLWTVKMGEIGVSTRS